MKAVFAPTAAIQSRTALATNSGPLSERTCQHVAQDEEVREDVDDIGRPEPAIDADRQAFPSGPLGHVRANAKRLSRASYKAGAAPSGGTKRLTFALKGLFEEGHLESATGALLLSTAITPTRQWRHDMQRFSPVSIATRPARDARCGNGRRQGGSED